MKKRIIALALMLVIAFSALPLANAADGFPFMDVPTYHKDRTAIEFCYKNGFIKGYSDTVFDPDGTLTREQFAVIWARTYHVRLHNFNDVTKIPNEYDNAIIFMQAYGQVNGISETEFGRTGKITREQAIAVTQRSYLPGVDGKDRYKDYSDYAQISDWARDAVSVCKLEGKLSGVFPETMLSPAQAITRGELCHLIFNFMRTKHTITVSGNIRNGEVAVQTGTDTAVTVEDGIMKALSGDTVTLTVKPDTEYVLAPGSLKYNGTSITGTSFTMPFEDVMITADFVPKIELIRVKVVPNKVSYKPGEKLDLTGMVIELKYVSGGVREITNYTTDPVANSTLNLTAGSVVNVLISYTENGVTVTTIQPISVTAAT